MNHDVVRGVAGERKAAIGELAAVERGVAVLLDDVDGDRDPVVELVVPEVGHHVRQKPGQMLLSVAVGHHDRQTLAVTRIGFSARFG